MLLTTTARTSFLPSQICKCQTYLYINGLIDVNPDDERSSQSLSKAQDLARGSALPGELVVRFGGKRKQIEPSTFIGT